MPQSTSEDSSYLPGPSQARTPVNSRQCSTTGLPPPAPSVPTPTTCISPPERPPAGLIKGSPSSYVAGIMEWTFTESQSNIQGRTGSNACAFIALLMGKVCMGGHLPWPTGDNLPESWRESLLEAMIRGNQLHDDLFDHQAVDLEVEDAVSLADNECGVQSVGHQTDIFGVRPVQQFANALIQEAQNSTSNSCHVIMTEKRAMLLVVNSDSSAVIVDSHSHGNDGAIIACSQAGYIHLLAQWLDTMMMDNWHKTLTLATITKILYF